MKIYFAGSIRGGRDKVQDFKKMIDFIEENGSIVLDKHIGDINLTSNGESLSNEEIYNRDINWLRKCDIVIAEVTTPSLGVGYELSFAESLGKKVYTISEKGVNVSGLIMGNSFFENYKYETIDEVLDIIKNILNNNEKIKLLGDNMEYED